MRILWMVFVALIAVSPQVALAEDTEREIVVSGEGTVSAAPDMATVFVGVSRQARRAGDALQEASEGAAAVLARRC